MVAAMAGNTPRKHPDDLKGNRAVPGRAQSALTALPPRDPASVTVPMPPDPTDGRELHRKALDAWERYWRSAVSSVADTGGGMPSIERWTLAIHEWWTLKEEFDKEPTTIGSLGQERINPLAGRISQVEGVIARYEDQLGLTPLSRIKLGIKLLEGEGGLRGFLGDLDGGDEDSIEVVTVDA